MDLIKDFDYGAFLQARQEVLYGGEELPRDAGVLPDIMVRAVLSGPAFKGHYNRQYLMQVGRSNLKAIYRDAKRGSVRAASKVQLLYRLGLGVPADSRLAALWSTVTPSKSAQLLDNSVVTYEDLLYVLKHHLNESFKLTGIEVYPHAYSVYCKNVFDYFDSSEPATKKFDAVTPVGSESDVFATYVYSGHQMRLSQVVVRHRGKIIDITVKAFKLNIVPRSLPVNSSLSIGYRLTFIGKFNNKVDIDLEDYVNKLINSFDIVDELNAPLAGKKKIVDELRRDERYIRARSIVQRFEQLPDKSKKNKRFVTGYNNAQAYILSHEAQVAKAKTALSRARDKIVMPVDALDFVVYDIVQTAPSVAGFNTGTTYKFARGDYSRLLSMIASYGFTTVKITKRISANTFKRVYDKKRIFWQRSK